MEQKRVGRCLCLTSELLVRELLGNEQEINELRAEEEQRTRATYLKND
jgi:hypothetical protein